MNLRLNNFAGLVPKLSPRLLGNNQSQVAENCRFVSGNIKPWSGPTTVAALPDAARKTIFPYPTTAAWLSWLNDVNVVRGPIAEDQYQRIYYTGDGVPKIRGIDGTQQEYTLGIPKPTVAPTVAVLQKTSITWTREWHYYYIESDGTVSQAGTLTEGEVGDDYGAFGVTKMAGYVGKRWIVGPRPTKTTASATASLTYWFTAADANGSTLGTLYFSPSSYSESSDFYLDSAKASGIFRAAPTDYLEITYDTSRTSDYTIDRAYVYTFVSAWGEEGPPSDASTIVAVDPSQYCALSAMDTAVAGDYNITKKRIYRTVTGDAGTEYRYFAEIDLATGTYTDEDSDDDAGEIIPSLNWIAPPTDLAGLVAMPGGFFAGFSGRTVYFSEPNYPHAWPAAYAVTVDHDIVALGVSQTSLIVATTGVPYVLTGTSPDLMSVSELSLRQACVSKRSMVQIDDLVIYASPDGLIACQGATGRNLTTAHYTREQWQAIGPSTMIGFAHDGRYYGFTDTTALIFDLYEGALGISTTTQTCAGGHADLETDLLYLISGANIVTWNTDAAAPLTIRWRTKKIEITRPDRFAVVRVLSDVYPVSVKVFAEDAQVAEVTLADDNARYLPDLRRERTWDFEMSGTGEIHELLVAQSMVEV